MQDKMATRNRAINAIYSASFYLWFPLFRWMARRLPLPFLYALARVTVGSFFRLRPKYQHAMRSNYSRILGMPADDPAVGAAVREMVDCHSYHWIDFFAFCERPPARAARLVAGITGYEKILAAEARGRGVILGTAHVGNWYIGGALLASQGHPISVVYKPDRFPIVEKYRTDMNRRSGVRQIPVGSTFLSGLPVARALAEGQIVAMQCDRDFNNTGIAVDFFGAPAYFPRGPFVAAMSTRAAFLPSFILRQPDGRYHVYVEDELPVSAHASHAEGLRAAVTAFVRIFEGYVRRYPTQWYCFYPFWDDPTRREAREAALPPLAPKAAKTP